MRKLLKIYIGILILVSGCEKESSQAVQAPLLKTKWTLSSIQDTKSHEITNFPNDAINKISIFFTDSLSIISFSGVCNTGKGTYSLTSDKDSIKISDIATTKIGCKYLEWERYVTDNLTKAFSYRINGNNLVIESNGTYNLNFTKN